MILDLRPDVGRLAAAAGAGFSTATDLADWLVRALGVPFRSAHHVTGRAVRRAEELCVELKDLSLDELRAIEPRITEEVYKVLSPEASVRSRTSFGGAAPVRAAEQIKRWKSSLS
jgi:argininosuccinate lyase